MTTRQNLFYLMLYGLVAVAPSALIGSLIKFSGLYLLPNMWKMQQNISYEQEALLWKGVNRQLNNMIVTIFFLLLLFYVF